MSRGPGRPSNPQPQPHPNNVLLDTAQNLFSKGFKNLSSVKHVLQGRVCLSLPTSTIQLQLGIGAPACSSSSCNFWHLGAAKQ